MMPPHGRPGSPTMRGFGGGMGGRGGMFFDYGMDYGGPPRGVRGPPMDGPGAGLRGDKRPRDWQDDLPPGRRGPDAWSIPRDPMDAMHRGGPGPGWGRGRDGGRPGLPEERFFDGLGPSHRDGGFGNGPGAPPPGQPMRRGSMDRGWSPPPADRYPGAGPYGRSAGRSTGFGGLPDAPMRSPGRMEPMMRMDHGREPAAPHRGPVNPQGFDSDIPDAIAISNVQEQEWYYTDPQGTTQGPCSIAEFSEWLTTLGADPQYREEYLKFKEVCVWKHGLKQQFPLERLVQRARSLMA